MLHCVGMFENVNEGHIPREGSVCVSCADGHQLQDIIGHLYDGRFPRWNRLWRFLRRRPSPCTHTLALNGGGLLLSPSCELDQGESAVLHKHIATALELKNLSVITPLAHYPCGAAALAHLSIEEVVHHLRAAAQELRRRFPEATVVPLFHIDWGCGRKRTYILKEDNPFFDHLSPFPICTAHAAE